MQPSEKTLWETLCITFGALHNYHCQQSVTAHLRIHINSMRERFRAENSGVDRAVRTGLFVTVGRIIRRLRQT